MKTIDLIIVNFNSTDCTIKLVNSIKSKIKFFAYNIVIIDNASNDFPERLSSYFPDIRIVFNNTNLGFSRAVNQASKRCHGQYIVTCNPDTLIIDDCLSEIVNFMSDQRDIGLVGPQIFDMDGNIQGSARTFPTFWTSIFGRKSPLTKIFPNNPFTKREFLCFNKSQRKSIEVDWVSGACMVIKRDVFDMVNGFDESFFLYWEDADICRRIKEAGYKIIYYPIVKVGHTVGVSSSTRPIQSIFHFHYSCFKLYRKYSPNSQTILIPVVLFGLSLRCLFVIALNYLSKIMKIPKGENNHRQ